MPSPRPILKQTTAGSEPRTLFASSDAQLFERAVEAYGQLASTLARNGAPAAISTDAFTTTESALAEMKTGYLKMISCSANFPYVYRHLHLKPDEADPVYWAYEILCQSLGVSAKQQPKRGLAVVGAVGGHNDDDESSPAKRCKVETRVFSFNRIEFSRDFTDDEWDLGDEAAYLTREYDGPSPLSLELDKLLVDRTISSRPRFGSNGSVAAAIDLKKHALFALVVFSLHNLLERINANDTRVSLFPSKLRLGRTHTYVLKSLLRILEGEKE